MPIENQLHRKSDPDLSSRNTYEPLLDIKSGNNARKERNFGRSLVVGGVLLAVLWGVDKLRQAIFSNEPQASSTITNVVSGFKNGMNDSRYSKELLRGMGDRMKEMGYGELSDEALSDLRDKGLTATWLGQIRNLGYEDLTLEDAIRLKDRDVSPTFLSMMQGLGYKLSVQDIMRLKDAGVKAQYTSQLADLGYTNLTVDELIRLKSAGVSVDLVKQLIRKNNGIKPAIEEIIRYRASNQ